MDKSNDIISKLPVEVVQEICMRITPETLCNVQKCCKKWRKVNNSEYFWKKRLEMDSNFGFVDQEYLKTASYQKYIKNFSSNLEGQYMYKRELIHNWRNGIFNRRIVSVPNKIEALIYLDDEILIVVVENDTILIIDIATGMIQNSLFVEEWYHVEKNGDRLLVKCRSPSDLGLRLMVWNLQSYEVIFDFQTDITNYSGCDHSFYKNLITCKSSEHGVSIYNIETGKLDYRKDGITDVHCSNDIIAMVTSSGSIEVMDIHYNPLMTFKCFNEAGCEVTRMAMKDDNLVTLFENSDEQYTICVCNLKTKVKLYTIKKLSLEMVNLFNGNILICETKDDIYSVFDVLTGKSILKLNSDERCYFISNNLYIIKENYETSCIELWCPRTKELINSIDLPEQYSVEYQETLYPSKLRPLVSKTTLAFLNQRNKRDVLVIDFGPGRNNETLTSVPHECTGKPQGSDNGTTFIGAMLNKLHGFMAWH